MKEKYLRWAIKFLVYASFLTPLIVMGDTFVFPFVFPKAIYFRILVELMLGLYILLCFINKEYLPKLTPVVISVLVWLVALFLASLLGTDFIRSFWGNYERMSGWFTLAHFAVYFLVITSVFKTWNSLKWLLRGLLPFSLLVGLTGVSFLLSDKSIMKIGGGGSLGNQIYLANYMLFFVFIAWYLFRTEQKLICRILSSSCLVIGIAIMIYNGKRGPFVGLLAGIFVAALLYSLFSKVKKWKVIGLSVLGGLIICGSLVMFFRQTEFVGKIPAIGSIAKTEINSGTAETRLIAWQIAWQAFKARPIFGWGVENFYYAFNQYYNPKSLEHGYYETWFDRSHNIFMDYLSTTGLIGFISYVGIFAVCGWVLVKKFKRQEFQLDELVFFSVFLIGYAVQNFFVFDHLSSYLVFFLVLALLNFSPSESQKFLEKNRVKKDSEEHLPIIVVILVTVGTIFLVYQTNLLPAKANQADFESQVLMQKDFSAGLSKMEKTLTLNPYYLVDIRNDFARAVIAQSQNTSVIKTAEFKEAAELVIKELKKTTQVHPLELQSMITLSQYYGLFGDLDKAEQTLKQALELSPKRQQLIYLLVRIKVMKKDYSGAIELLNQAIKDDAKIPDNYWYLSLIYIDLGEQANSYDNLKLAVQYNKSFITSELILAGKIAKQNKDWLLAQELLEKALVDNQNNVSVLSNLSEVYNQLGDKDKAQEMLDRAILNSPKSSSTVSSTRS